MSDQHIPPEGQGPEQDHNPIITKLSIPDELVDDPASQAWRQQKRSPKQAVLSGLKLLAGAAWSVAVLSVIFRLTDGLMPTQYAFLKILPVGEAGTVDLRRLFALFGAGAAALGGLAGIVCVGLCASGASKRPGEGPILLLLSVASLGLAVMLYFLW